MCFQRNSDRAEKLPAPRGLSQYRQSLVRRDDRLYNGVIWLVALIPALQLKVMLEDVHKVANSRKESSDKEGKGGLYLVICL